MNAPAYIELEVTSNYSFLAGASHPDELVRTAAALGHGAIGLADQNSLGGLVKAHQAADAAGLRFLPGCRLIFQDRPDLLCYPTDRAAYGRLCRLLTLGKRRAAKGGCLLTDADLDDHHAGQILILIPPETLTPGAATGLRRHLQADRARFGDRLYLAARHRYGGDDAARIRWLADAAAGARVPLVATNDVLYHTAERRALQDVIACIRRGTTIEAAGRSLLAHGERHLKPPAEIARLFRHHPAALAHTIEIAGRCDFSLKSLRHDYPTETRDGIPAQQALEQRTADGVIRRYGPEPPAAVRTQIAHELALIAELGYAPYFLTVHDIVRFAESRAILCQGRGSAANSAVCYCLGITAIDPVKGSLLFERFISHARREPPDIDVDFAHERREEVIQHIYATYGRDRAGLAATVICYHRRGALREVAKVMGLSADVVAALRGAVWGWSGDNPATDEIRAAGLDPDDPRLRLTLRLADELVGFPRHLSQHVGGFVITAGPLAELGPIANAAMADRTVLEWDKDDLDALGILKIDILALGMLTCIDKALALVARHHGQRWTLATLPAEEPEVYAMLSRADSVGVFQIESRAQMSMLPRLKPRCFYDLVIEVAIVRPGPIQGDMVHPYLRRREGREPVVYPSAALEAVLGKTLGVPLFQEQAMKIAMVAAGFSAAEADELRRAMATFKRVDRIRFFRDRLIEGMVERGYDREFATRCFKQIEGFGTYGFPESHAASFALLVYVSAWLKWRHPEAFAAALLNSQPMGFYAPAQIVRDAREHGVEVRPVDLNHSDWDCTLEPTGLETSPILALRLGLRLVRGLSEAAGRGLAAARGSGYGSVEALARRAGLDRGALEQLARADAFRSIGLDRRAALWAVKGLVTPPPLFAGIADLNLEPAVTLPAMPLARHVVEDYGSLGLSLKRHPVAFLRTHLSARGLIACAGLASIPDGRHAHLAGLVLVRQRPGTARGVIFLTLEDETGIANIIVWPALFERSRRAVIGSRLLAVAGRVQKEGLVIHLIADRLTDLSADLNELMVPDQRLPDLVMPDTPGDEVRHPGHDARQEPAPLRLRSRDFC